MAIRYGCFPSGDRPREATRAFGLFVKCKTIARGVQISNCSAQISLSSIAFPWMDLVVIAEFRDTIYPGLVSTGKVEQGDDKPFHTIINGENFHVLKALTYTHRGKVDAIYIDPPYNSGAKDWKYNNDYVEGDDLYRHSKWLAMMERRLELAKNLLNPEDFGPYRDH